MLLPFFLLFPVVLANETETRPSSLLIDCNQINLERCPTDAECSKLSIDCFNCMCPTDCLYGQVTEVSCRVHQDIVCIGNPEVKKSFECRYCFQTVASQYNCKDNFDCQSTGDPNKLHYRANCSVYDDVLCLGRRQFMKQKKCNWTGGYKWSTALALSVTLGGFGADRCIMIIIIYFVYWPYIKHWFWLTT